jgi:dolichol kinase
MLSSSSFQLEIASILLGATLCLAGLSVTWGSGRLVELQRLHVGYSRKLNHFLIFFLPIMVTNLTAWTGIPLSALALSLIQFHLFLLACTPAMQRQSPLCRTMLAAIDRPEDRPYTLWWLWSQMVLGYLALGPWFLLLRQQGALELIQIPILINGVGDGLAEVVGVRYGRHRYRVPSLVAGRHYTRSYEGSLCVLLVGILVMCLYLDSFSQTQFWWAIGLVPAVMTLGEAWSPHTWDTPILFTLGSATLVAILAWCP